MQPISLLPTKDTAGRAIPVTLRKSTCSGAEQFVIRFGETGRDEYSLSTLVEVALQDGDGLTVDDLYDGSQNYTIPLMEIQAVVRQFLYPRLMQAGSLEVDVKFVSSSADFPF